MVLNYHPTNYTGWPVPAGFSPSYHIAKVQKIFELCKFLSNYFAENQIFKC